jgi:hypothetical protein
MLLLILARYPSSLIELHIIKMCSREVFLKGAPVKQVRGWIAQIFGMTKPQANTAQPIKEQSHPLLEELDAILAGFKPEWFLDYRSEQGTGIRLHPAYLTIDAYSEALHEYVEVLKSQNNSATNTLPELCRWLKKDVFVNDFFLSKDHYYQNTHDVVRTFIDSTKAFSAAVRESDESSVSSAMYNRRLLAPLVTNLKDILTSLVDIAINND